MNGFRYTKGRVRRLGLVALLLLLTGWSPTRAECQGSTPGAEPGLAQHKPTSKQEASGRAAYDQLMKRRGEKLLQYNRIIAGKQTKRRREETFQKYYPHPENWAARFFDVHESYPGTVAAARSLTWVVTHWRDSELDYRCRDILFKSYLRHAFLDEVCRSLRLAKQPRAKQDLRFLFENSPIDSVKGRACLALCELALSELEIIDSAALRATTEKLVKLLGSRYAAIQMGRMTGAQWGARYRLELDHLSLGQSVLDWNAKDLSGKQRSLAQTRGKVVLLFFWKSNSRSARLALPHVRSLINKYAGERFVVYGISGDLDRKRAVRWQTTLRLQFPNWHVPSTIKNPGVWGVSNWPTFFVLSPKGRILAARTDWKTARNAVAEAMVELSRDGQTPSSEGAGPAKRDDSQDWEKDAPQRSRFASPNSKQPSGSSDVLQDLAL